MTFLASIRLLDGAEPASFTRTLDISILGINNFYINVPDDWLAIATSRLPALRSLRFAKSPLLDSKAISYLQGQKYKYIRFFDVSYCNNVTSERLSSVITLLPQLYFLDIAGHRGLRAAGVLGRIKDLAHLRILCLQECNLVDSDLTELFECIDDSSLHNMSRIQSLNLSHNKLTDTSFKILSTHNLSTQNDDMMLPSYNETIDSAPQLSPLEDTAINTFERKLRYVDVRKRRGFSLQDNFEKVMTYLEDPNLPDPARYMPGLTNLYISGNKITFSGLSKLSALHQIEALDIGSVELGEDHSVDCPKEDTETKVSRLYQAIDSCHNLQYLRVSHRVVTGSRVHSDKNDLKVSFSI